MGRRSLAIGIGLVVAVAAAVAGTLAVTGIGDDDGGSAPTGAQTVLRLEPQDDTVSCGAPAPVYIYLDDLEARPSPRDASVSYGVSAFQVLLHYDPAVVRIARAVDIELNPALSQEDADGDGRARSFIPAASLDDGAGEVLLGAASVVTAAGPEGQQEEGLDPVAKGEPLLLMTVRFLPVGEGTTELRIDDGTAATNDLQAALEEPLVLDPSEERYDLVLEDASLTVEGGDCPEGPFATPKPTPLPTSTPGIEPFGPTTTPVVWRTVTAPDAPEAGRDDCPADWVAYVDSQERFSICYPADFGATASDFALNASSPASSADAPRVGIIASWSEGSGHYYGPPSSETCSKYTSIVEGPLSSEFIEVDIDGRTVAACLTVGPIQSSLHGSIAIASDGSEEYGFVHFAINFIDADLGSVPPLGTEILQTLSVSFR